MNLSQLSDNEAKAVEVFCRICDEIDQCRFIQQARTQDHSIHWRKNDNGTEEFRAPEYNMDEVRSFATHIRKLTGPNESTHILKVANVLGKCGYPAEIKALQLAPEVLAQVEHGFWTTTVNGKDFNLRQIIDTIFYADIFHSDINRQDDLADLRELWPFVMMDFVRYCASIFYIANNIRLMVKAAE